MGLFSKKDPCAICGGKVDVFLPVRIEGQLVCDNCADKIDMPDDRRNALTLDSFRQYLDYYEANRNLASQFRVSAQVGLSPYPGGSVFDFENHLFCLDDDLKKLVFEGNAVRSFTISEDQTVIFEGRPDGLRQYESKVKDKMQAMAPQAAMVQMQNRIEEERERMERLHQSQNPNQNDPRPVNVFRTYGDFQEPFQKFHINIQLDHPYYTTISFDYSGPNIIDSDPDVNRYLREYDRDFEKMRAMAEALANVAFPGKGYVDQNAPAAAVQAAPAAAAAPVDAAGEIKKFKELLDSGIITEEEFNAKKRQLLGL